jgi:hypothetical protein
LIFAQVEQVSLSRIASESEEAGKEAEAVGE